MVNLSKDVITLKVSDIKGNYSEEVIYLVGNKEGDGKNTTYNNMEIIISDGENGELSYISLKEIKGYEPKLKVEKFKDKENNQILFISKNANEEEGLKALIYDFYEGKLKKDFDSDKFKNNEYEVIFIDNFKVEIINNKKEKTYIMDIKDKNKEYLSNKYSYDGKLKRRILGKVLPIYEILVIKDNEKECSNILIKRNIIGEDACDILGEIIDILSFESMEFKIVESIVSIKEIKNDKNNYRNNEILSSKYDFSRIEFIEAEENPNKKLERILEKEFNLTPKVDKLSYLYNRFKLNDLYENQIIAYLEGPKFCSDKGGTLIIVDEKNNEYSINSRVIDVIPPIIITNKKNKGYKNLIVKVNSNGKEEFRVLKYNGNSYPINPFEEEKLKKDIRIIGSAVISDDLFYRNGIEY